jgi:hypothetical protein
MNMTFIPRLHGPILTHASTTQLADCIRRGQYNAQKVITGWGPQGPWTDATRRQVVTTTVVGSYPPKTIVRTVAGDGQYGRGYANDPNNPELFPLPDKIEQEVAPWYALDSKIYIEIGNEPNNEEGPGKPRGWWNYYNAGTEAEKTNAETYIWNWKYWFGQSLQRIRARFPGAKVISPGLAKQGADKWHQICQDAFSQADFNGFHHFGGESFTEDWGKLIIPQLKLYYPTKNWFCTEYGLHSQADWIPQKRNGTLYGELVHFDVSDPVWPANVKGATYFHLDTRSVDTAIEPAYVIYGNLSPDGRRGGGDEAYRDRKLDAPIDRLGVNGRLNRGSALRSLNGRYTLHLQAGDGNLVLYNASGVAIWSSYRPGGEFLILQGDGNLVVYRSDGGALWASNTVGSGAQALVVQDDGNMVLYNSTQAVWATNTVGR